MKIWYSLLLLIILTPLQAQKSTNHYNHTLLIFSGSDWCIPCIRFQHIVLNDTTFQAFAKSHFNLVEADFPQRKKLSDSLVQRNEELAEKYNPDGAFPHVALINHEGDVIKVLNTDVNNAKDFIAQLKPFFPEKELKEYSRKELLMGSSFEFSIVCDDPAKAQKLLDQSVEKVKRLEGLISEWSDTTEISHLNALAGIKPLQLHPEVYDLIKKCIAISKLTQGAFDITFHGVGIWNFDKKDHDAFPDSAAVKSELVHIGYSKIKLLDSNKAELSQKGMAIGFGAIGKGTAAEMVKQMLIANGIKSGVISAGGDLSAWGTKPDGSPWKIGIADPEHPYDVLLWLPVKDKAVATSGSYEKYFTYHGKRYAHILDPKTGYPITDKKSVTVISNSAELSDALATALFVMDIQVGLYLVKQMPGVDCIIIDSQNKKYFSRDIELIE